MALKITATIEGEVQLSQELGLSVGKLKDFSAPLRGVNTELLKSINLNFDTEGRLFQSGGWAERKSGGDWPILVKTGAMRSSFESNISPSQLVIENFAPYFKYHQSNKKRTKLPRRMMMLIDAARQTFIVKAFQRHIVDSTRGLRG